LKKMGYNLVKLWIKASLHLYYGRIDITGLENVPQDKPVLFLPNHQNALLDVLLIAVDCNRKPYFLTRSDIFRSRILIAIFDFFRMIPIYRIRDGRESLKNNNAVFERCAHLLGSGEAILMFPEANHNLKRRVRTLSKGFTRILFAALEEYPKLDIGLVPVGFNYRDAEAFPDQVAIHYGKAFDLQDLLIEKDKLATTQKIKETVTEALKDLTTHIENEEAYESIISQLDAQNLDYLNPTQVNKAISPLDENEPTPQSVSKNSFIRSILKGLFTILNLPVVILWRLLIKPKVWEPEFTATLRFALALLVFPIYYLALFIGFYFWCSTPIAVIGVASLFVFNWFYVKQG